MSSNLNSYELSRAFTDWAFENPEKIKPIHYAIYFFAIEHCNRLGWKKNFGLPSQMVMEAIGVKNWRTYSNALKDLVDFGFIIMVETSRNQYSSNIVAIVKNTKAQSKALDKALSKHSQKQGTKQGQGTVSINKQETKNKEQLNKEHILLCSISSKDELDNNHERIAFAFWELFKGNLKSAGIENTTTLDKAKLNPWANDVRLMMEQDKRTRDEMTEVFKFLQFDDFWKRNIQSTSKLRKQFERLLMEARKPQKNSGKIEDDPELQRKLVEIQNRWSHE